MNECCAIRLGLRYFRHGAARDGDRSTCSACGQSFRRVGFLWMPISTVDDIADLLAHDPRAVRHSEPVS